MRRSGWLTFSAVVLIIAGIMRVIDAIWALGYNGALPDNLQGALVQYLPDQPDPVSGAHAA